MAGATKRFALRPRAGKELATRDEDRRKAEREQLMSQMTDWRDRANDDVSWFSVFVGALGALVAVFVAAVTQSASVRVYAFIAFAYITPVFVSYFYFLDTRRYQARVEFRALEAEWMAIDPPQPSPWSRNALLPQSPRGIWPLFSVLVIGWLGVDLGVSLYAAGAITQPATDFSWGGLPAGLAVTALSLPGAICIFLLAAILLRAYKEERLSRSP